MPKASFAAEDLYTPSSRGFVETVGSRRLGEIVSAVSRFHQWQPNKNTGAQQAPLTAAFLGIREIDGDGNYTTEAIEQELVVEWGPKDDSLIRVRPGLADSADDGDPKDTAEEGVLVLGAEGNCLYVEEGTKLNGNNGYLLFTKSLQDKGFKPQVLANGFLPDLIGTRAWFDLKPGKKKDDGSAYNDFVVSEVTRFPYETKAVAKAPAAKKTTAPKPAAAPATPAAPSPAANGHSGDAEQIALEFLKQVANEQAAKEPNPPLSRSKIIVMALQKALSPAAKVDKSLHKPIQETLKNKDWFVENSLAFGCLAAEKEDEFTLVGA